MSARSKARKRALDALYEADIRGIDAVEVLTELDARRQASGEDSMNEYAHVLVQGVRDHHIRIDEILATYATGWTLERMPAVDRNVLRIGTFEVLWNEQVPDEVAISQAVELVTELSTDESPAFVNGLLARISGVKSRLMLEA